VFVNANAGNHQGETFLVVDANGVDGYQAGQDLVLHIVSPAAFQVGVAPVDMAAFSTALPEMVAVHTLIA
jgi:hypothetical protein